MWNRAAENLLREGKNKGRILNINYWHLASAAIEAMAGVDDRKESCPNLADTVCQNT
jgi:hypothetical protein